MEALAQLEKKVASLICLISDLREQRQQFLHQVGAQKNELERLLKEQDLLKTQLADFEAAFLVQDSTRSSDHAKKLDGVNFTIGELIKDIDQIIKEEQPDG
ncbi:hypothetical protein HOK96_02935 [bacterium]|jgi:hypothetical protein|nr:hypothetical protein [bacterium]MBT3904016.1 hypothetical protein [bacterium]MBT4577441.1 hypothetical protein [bacterium]MBT5345974.1 hypothetical protein [bacterium]MBT6130760.1 hypothetical protein [bacterium]